jgi:hypothetical protein
MDDQTNVVTIRLEGADLELLRAGQAQGEATGLRLAIDAVREAMHAWGIEVEKVAPEKAAEISRFVASYEPMFNGLSSKAEARTIEGRAAMARAVSAGAGRPRASASLRRRASKAMMAVARWLEGS